MKFKSLYLLPVLMLLFFTACEQEPEDQIDYYFCTTTPTDDTQWDLYVDGDLIGKLPYVTTVPNCGNASALTSLLHVSLSEKRHSYQAKDPQGTVRAAGNFQYKEKDNGTKKAHGAIGIGGKGGSSGDWSCDLVVMSVFE
jgi:hypothetical protein